MLPNSENNNTPYANPFRTLESGSQRRTTGYRRPPGIGASALAKNIKEMVFPRCDFPRDVPGLRHHSGLVTVDHGEDARDHPGANTTHYGCRQITREDCDNRIAGKTLRRACSRNHRSRL